MTMSAVDNQFQLLNANLFILNIFSEEVMIEKDGVIKDQRLDFSFNIKDILNR